MRVATVCGLAFVVSMPFHAMHECMYGFIRADPCSVAAADLVALPLAIRRHLAVASSPQGFPAIQPRRYPKGEETQAPFEISCAAKLSRHTCLF